MDTLEKISSFITLSFNSFQLHWLLLIVLIVMYQSIITPIIQFTISMQAKNLIHYIISSLIIICSYLILYQFIPNILKWADFKIVLQGLALYGVYCFIIHLVHFKNRHSSNHIVK